MINGAFLMFSMTAENTEGLHHTPPGVKILKKKKNLDDLDYIQQIPYCFVVPNSSYGPR